LTNSKSGLATRLKIVSVMFSTSFMGMAACLVVSITFSDYDGRGADLVTAFYLGFDCLCVCTLVYLFAAAVTEMGRTSDSSTKPDQGSRNKSSKGSTKNTKDLAVDVEEPIVAPSPMQATPVVTPSSKSTSKLSPAERRAQMRQSLMPSKSSSISGNEGIQLVVGEGSSLERKDSQL